MWNVWSRIVRPKKRKAVSFEVGMAYDVMGQTMVVAETFRNSEGCTISLVSVKAWREIQRGKS
jgi:hypothetical protein